MSRGRRGAVGTSMSMVKMSGQCKHSWTRFERAGIFDSTMRRTCRNCGRIQTRKPKKKPPLAG